MKLWVHFHGFVFEIWKILGKYLEDEQKMSDLVFRKSVTFRCLPSFHETCPRENEWKTSMNLGKSEGNLIQVIETPKNCENP
jgi:hypothetical protein